MRRLADGTIIAESTSTESVEGNHYFPPSSIKKEYFKVSVDAFSAVFHSFALSLLPLGRALIRRILRCRTTQRRLCVPGKVSLRLCSASGTAFILVETSRMMHA